MAGRKKKQEENKEDTSLFSKIGGQDMIQNIVQNFLEKATSNSKLKSFFIDVNSEDLQGKIIWYLTKLFGSPVDESSQYATKSLKKSLKLFKISQEEYNLVLSLFCQSLTDLKQDQQNIQQIKELLQNLKKDIVNFRHQPMQFTNNNKNQLIYEYHHRYFLQEIEDKEENNPTYQDIIYYTPGYKYNSGAIYKGVRHGTSREGEGTCIWPDGSKFEGQWQKNLPIAGKFTHKNQSIYEGSFQNCKANGNAKMKYQGGLTYEGPWEEDKQQGEGIEIWEDGSIYKGNFSKGAKHGYGVLQWSDGVIYEGNWQENLINGQGKFISSDKKTIFEGNWQINTTKNIVPLCTWKFGKKYEAEYYIERSKNIRLLTWWQRHESQPQLDLLDCDIVNQLKEYLQKDIEAGRNYINDLYQKEYISTNRILEGPWEEIVKEYINFQQIDLAIKFLEVLCENIQDYQLFHKLIEVAIQNSKNSIAEEIIKNKSDCYDSIQLKDIIMQLKPDDPQPLIVLCDIKNHISDMIQYLYRNKQEKFLESYIQNMNPLNQVEVLSILIDMNLSEEDIKQIINNISNEVNIELLVEKFEKKEKLRYLKEYLDVKISEDVENEYIKSVLEKLATQSE